MANAPHIEITGNLVRDPELRFTSGGHAVCNFTVAVTPRKRAGDGSWEDGDPQFWDVVTWRNLAENCAESLMRGDPVTVIGSVNFREWEDKQGDKRHQHEITADTVSVPLAFHTVRIKRANRKGNTDPASEARGELAGTGK